MKSHGLTLIEVVVAMSILAIILVVFSATTVGNIRQNVISGSRTGSTQLLNYIGRKVSAGIPEVLPANSTSGTKIQWGYNQIRTTFTDLADVGGLSDPDRYRAEVESLGPWTTVSGSDLVNYRIKVCWQEGTQEICAQSLTVAPVRLATGSPIQVTGN